MKKFTSLNESNSNPIFKLGLDIHGVIDKYPKEMSFLSNSIISYGGEVHIITGGSWNKELDDLLSLSKIKWTKIFSIYDHLIEMDEDVEGLHTFKDGKIQSKFKSDVWDKAKSEYCSKNEISLHIDDNPLYGSYFNTPFAKMF